MVNIGTLLAFVIVCIAVMILRNTNPDQPRPFRTPLVPFVPILGIGFNGYMMYKLGWINWARLIIWLIYRPGRLLHLWASPQPGQPSGAAREITRRSQRAGLTKTDALSDRCKTPGSPLVGIQVQ